MSTFIDPRLESEKTTKWDDLLGLIEAEIDVTFHLYREEHAPGSISARFTQRQSPIDNGGKLELTRLNINAHRIVTRSTLPNRT